MSPSTLGARLGIAAAAATLSLGGLSAAAMTGSLPDSAQHVAHQVGAPPVSDEGDETEDSTEATEPAETRTDDSTESDSDATKTEDSETRRSAPAHAVGPDATGPAAFGLCNAYSHAGDKGQAAERSVAFRNLTEAAGGEDKVEAYCADVEHPSGDAKATGEDADSGATHPSGRPTDKPKHEKPATSSHTQHKSGASGATVKSHGKSGSHRH
ncbi:MAG TPA: protein tyrosine phosphatase [Pedococcus sp.]|nr:protein tyrosine phosphatase [Pedococcus sp.]